MKETAEISLLSRFLTEPTIRVLAGDTYYRRGLDYFRRGHVASVEEWENTLHATVRGTETYAVEISATSERLDFECDCPLGDDGEFCKHCVAAALAWVHRAGDGDEARIGIGGQRNVSKSAPTKFRKTAAKITPKEIASVLGAMDKSALIDLILEWAREEPGLRAKLTRHAAFALGPETAVREARLSLERRSASAAMWTTARRAATRAVWIRRSTWWRSWSAAATPLRRSNCARRGCAGSPTPAGTSTIPTAR
jgi:uncharacterized Zn finger protein